jgi:ankyrin repeat protein
MLIQLEGNFLFSLSLQYSPIHLPRNAILALLSDTHMASTNLVAPTLAILLSRGANVNLPPSEKYSSVLQAAISLRHVHLIDTLLDAGADVNANDPRFGTALTEAARMEDTVWAKKLLERGADPVLSGGSLGTPLQAAAYWHRIPMLSLLLAHPTSPNPNQFSPTSEYGYALHAACHSKEAIPTISFLLDHGADINARGGKYETALQCAAEHGHLETVKFLVERGADMAVKGGEHGSAMEAATANGHRHVVRFLRRHEEEKGAGVPT